VRLAASKVSSKESRVSNNAVSLFCGEGWEGEGEAGKSSEIVVALFKFCVVGSVASVGKSFHKDQDSRRCSFDP
jgi:hypothetical protein